MSQEREHPDQMRPGDEAPADEPAAGENVCPQCSGKGSVEGERCSNCEGTGTITEAVGGG